MSTRAGLIQAVALAAMGVAVFTTLARAEQLGLAVMEGVLIPAAVFYEWWSARPNNDPSAAVGRMAAIVSLALLGIVLAQRGI